jgi:DNA-binding response OmpR family regulator
MGIECKAAPTVLLVDDDEDLLHIVELKLKAEGFQILISLNGDNVRGIIAHYRPDLVLLDLHMQGVDGSDICKDIKSDPHISSIPILLFSANDNIKAIKEECGADGYIAKPFQTKNLAQTIQRYIPGMPGA